MRFGGDGSVVITIKRMARMSSAGVCKAHQCIKNHDLTTKSHSWNPEGNAHYSLEHIAYSFHVHV